jgi:type I restriction-modification system DNA methylase subunit
MSSDQRESPRAFLDEVYRSLGYEEGTLLKAAIYPDAETDEEWLDKGDWLALAHKVGAEKVFFVKSDPALVFCVLQHGLGDERLLLEKFRRVWCMSRPLLLFVALPGELRVYRLDRPPTREVEVLREKRQIELIGSVAEVARRLQDYRREEVESGRLFSDDRFGGIDQRADRQLIQDLKTVRKQLLVTGLEVKYVHGLIGRSIFIRYLEDREIIDAEYFEKVAKRDPRWQEKLSRKPERSDLAPGNEKRRYYRVLLEKKFTYALFQQLADDFNGDMFPKDEEEEKKVRDIHLKLLHDFLLGDTNQGQPHLFLWAYDFEIIPIELISSIYEEFYHKENIYHPGVRGENRRQNDVKPHYTPSVLVEYVLSNILPRERLAQKPRVLDPACGSGIFLVESFRRIVRYHVQQRHGEMVSPDVLRQILREQIRGIEINEEAVHVAAFSLYLALLHYQGPPDIRTKRLPHLIYQEKQLEDDDHYHVLFNKNVFALIDEEREQIEKKLNLSLRYKGRADHERLYNSQAKMPLRLHSFDIIIGNPPWGFEKGSTEEIREAQEQAKLWCEYFGWSIGYEEPSQTFIARSLSLLNISGECGLLVPTGVFLKHHEHCEEFRQRWLMETTIKTVVNFAHVRHAFFDANAPFAFVHFVVLPAPSDHWVRYWSVKKTEVVEKTQAIVLGQPDIRQVKQLDLAYNDFLWKVYWWGNHHDARLIKALRLDRTIDELAQMRDWPRPGRGFQAASPTYRNYPSAWLKSYQVLPADYLQRYGPIDPSLLTAAPQEITRLPSSSRIQSGWRLLIGQGITERSGINGRVEARLEDQPYAFNSSIHGLNVDEAEDWERKVLIGILWSSLARYYYFMTVSSWGTWRHQLHLEEAMSLPVRFPRNPELRDEIVNLVNTLMDWPVSWRQDPLALRPEVEPVERKLDDAIFRLYELSEEECDLVLDLCEVNLEFFYRHSRSYAARTLERYPLASQGTINDLPAERVRERGLEGYLYAFLQVWNRELAPEGEFSWRVLRPSYVPMIAVVFTSQELGDALPVVTATDDEEWREALKRCGEALKQPVSRRIYIDSMVRAVTDTEIYIIKRDERRLWTRSMAREDAEATLVQVMHLQEEAMRETV